MTKNEIVNRCLKSLNKKTTKKDIELWSKFIWQDELEFRRKFNNLFLKHLIKSMKGIK